MSREWPRQCMRTQGQPASATSFAIAGSPRPPETSLTMVAPTANASAATLARVVSMLTGSPAAASSRTTGRTRAISVGASIRSAPGRVDSPPTSTMSAPSARMATPCATAASRSAYRPPSENESGVTLRTPITTGRRTGSAYGAALRHRPYRYFHAAGEGQRWLGGAGWYQGEVGQPDEALTGGGGHGEVPVAGGVPVRPAGLAAVRYRRVAVAVAHVRI